LSVYTLIALSAVALVALLAYQFLSRSMLQQLTNGRLEGADYWRNEPVILSAGMGFDNIIGLPELMEETVHQAGIMVRWSEMYQRPSPTGQSLDQRGCIKYHRSGLQGLC
jgi:hypothetical protein